MIAHVIACGSVRCGVTPSSSPDAEHEMPILSAYSGWRLEGAVAETGCWCCSGGVCATVCPGGRMIQRQTTPLVDLRQTEQARARTARCALLLEAIMVACVHLHVGGVAPLFKPRPYLPNAHSPVRAEYLTCLRIRRSRRV